MPKFDGRDPTHPNIEAALESPSLFLTSQSESTAVNFVELNEGFQEPRVGHGVAEVLAEESSELVKSVQTASSDHIK